MRRAREEDFDVVFGREGGERFSVGQPIAMDEAKVTIDLGKLVERPSGIFGQTGTGKSVLTRLVLFGLIRADAASPAVLPTPATVRGARVCMGLLRQRRRGVMGDVVVGH